MPRTLRFIPATVEELDTLGSPVDPFTTIPEDAASLAEALADDDGSMIAVSTLDATVLTRSIGYSGWREETSGHTNRQAIFSRSDVTSARILIDELALLGGGASDRIQLNTQYIQMLLTAGVFTLPPAADVVWNGSGVLLAEAEREDALALTLNGDGLTPPTAALLRLGDMRVEMVWLMTAEELAPVTLRVDRVVLEVVVADPVSIRERIARVLVEKVADAAGVTEVKRWGREVRLDFGKAVVVLGADAAADGGEGTDVPTGLTEKKLEAAVFVSAQLAENSPLVQDAVVNQFLAEVEAAVLADPTLVEPSGIGNEERLAIDTRVTEVIPPLVVDDQPDIAAQVTFEITYRHLRESPYEGDYATLFTE